MMKWAENNGLKLEDTTPASWKEKEGEGAGSSGSIDGRRDGGEKQMCEVSRSDTG